MPVISMGRYAARIAADTRDTRKAQRLRFRAFRAGREGAAGAADRLDRDDFDARCDHVLVEDRADGTAVACFRVMALRDGSEIGRSYAAQHYALDRLRDFTGPMIEMGRFCLHPERRDPDILRLAWAAMTRYVDAHAADMLIGCSSFHGTDAERYLDSFALLRQRHLAPEQWRPRIKAPRVVRFARMLRGRTPDHRRAMQRMPPLLRSYLTMGGWVSDHAVVDPDLNTLHVFTGLEIRAMPAARKRLLRATAAQGVTAGEGAAAGAGMAPHEGEGARGRGGVATSS